MGDVAAPAETQKVVERVGAAVLDRLFVVHLERGGRPAFLATVTVPVKNPPLDARPGPAVGTGSVAASNT